MKTVLVLAAFVAIAVAAPADLTPSKPIGLLYRDEKQDAFGQFATKYETENGIIVTRQGSLKPIGEDGDHVLVQSGSESWTSPEGTRFLLTWSADEEGYRATGDHIPVAPVAA